MNLNTYLVRVNRRKNGIPHSFVGIVEEVMKRKKRAFANLDDHRDILNSKKGIVPRKRGSRKEADDVEKESRLQDV